MFVIVLCLAIPVNVGFEALNFPFLHEQFQSLEQNNLFLYVSMIHL